MLHLETNLRIVWQFSSHSIAKIVELFRSKTISSDVVILVYRMSLSVLFTLVSSSVLHPRTRSLIKLKASLNGFKPLFSFGQTFYTSAGRGWLQNTKKTVCLEQFANDCRKTNSKVITPTNHNRSKQSVETIRIASNYM